MQGLVYYKPTDFGAVRIKKNYVYKGKPCKIFAFTTCHGGIYIRALDMKMAEIGEEPSLPVEYAVYNAIEAKHGAAMVDYDEFKRAVVNNAEYFLTGFRWYTSHADYDIFLNVYGLGLFVDTMHDPEMVKLKTYVLADLAQLPPPTVPMLLEDTPARYVWAAEGVRGLERACYQSCRCDVGSRDDVGCQGERGSEFVQSLTGVLGGLNLSGSGTSSSI